MGSTYREWDGSSLKGGMNVDINPATKPDIVDDGEILCSIKDNSFN